MRPRARHHISIQIVTFKGSLRSFEEPRSTRCFAYLGGNRLESESTIGVTFLAHPRAEHRKRNTVVSRVVSEGSRHVSTNRARAHCSESSDRLVVNNIRSRILVQAQQSRAIIHTPGFIFVHGSSGFVGRKVAIIKRIAEATEVVWRAPFLVLEKFASSPG